MFMLPILGSTVIPNSQKRGEFWGSTGAWCWVSERYQVERYLFVYVSTLYCLVHQTVFTSVTDVDLRQPHLLNDTLQ